MIIASRHIPLKGFKAITLFPLIIVRSDAIERFSWVDANHERIHLAQQKELLVIPFYLIYSIEYLVRLVKYRNRRKAYLSISFEKEAYDNQRNTDYLQRRRQFTWMKYFNPKK